MTELGIKRIMMDTKSVVTQFGGNLTAGALGGSEGASLGSAANPVPSGPGNVGGQTQNALGTAAGSTAGTVAGRAVGAAVTAQVTASFGEELGAGVGLAAGPVGVIAGAAVGYGVGLAVGYGVSYAVGTVYNHREAIENTVTSILNAISPTVPMYCFPRGTSIALPSGSKQIEDIIPGDIVLSFLSDERNNLTLSPARVVRVFRSVTEDWLVLSNKLVVTPGHLFLNEFNKFERIDSVIQRGGMIVSRHGEFEKITAERILYSAQTSHLFEEVIEIAYQTNGSNALLPSIERGWRAYNFEVEKLHTYIAEGYLVHNDSIDSYNGLVDDLNSLGPQQTVDAYSQIGAQFGIGAIAAASLVS